MKNYSTEVLRPVHSGTQVHEPGCLVSHIDDSESIGTTISSHQPDRHHYSGNAEMIQVLWSKEPDISLERAIKSRIQKSLLSMIGIPLDKRFKQRCLDNVANVLEIFRNKGQIQDYSTDVCDGHHTQKMIVEIKYSKPASNTTMILTFEF